MRGWVPLPWTPLLAHNTCQSPQAKATSLKGLHGADVKSDPTPTPHPEDGRAPPPPLGRKREVTGSGHVRQRTLQGVGSQAARGGRGSGTAGGLTMSILFDSR